MADDAIASSGRNSRRPRRPRLEPPATAAQADAIIALLHDIRGAVSLLGQPTPAVPAWPVAPAFPPPFFPQPPLHADCGCQVGTICANVACPRRVAFSQHTVSRGRGA